MHVTNSSLQHNHAGREGGALYIFSDFVNFSVVIHGCALVSNSAQQSAGAVFIHFYNVKERMASISSSFFLMNAATQGQGGALYALLQDVKTMTIPVIYNITFANTELAGNSAMVSVIGGNVFRLFG